VRPQMLAAAHPKSVATSATISDANHMMSCWQRRTCRCPRMQIVACSDNTEINTEIYAIDNITLHLMAHPAGAEGCQVSYDIEGLTHASCRHTDSEHNVPPRTTHTSCVREEQGVCTLA